MPWDCKSCGTSDLKDSESACPECQRVKTAWTLVVDRTRTLTVSRKKFVLQKGNGTRPEPAGQSQVTLSGATKITVLSKSDLRTYSEDGNVPPSAYVVFATLYPRRSTDLTVELALIYGAQATESQGYPDAASLETEGVHYAQFVFTYGQGDVSDVSFPDITIVDLSEGDGFAPSVEFSALGKKAQELPTTATKLRRFAFSI